MRNGWAGHSIWALTFLAFVASTALPPTRAFAEATPTPTPVASLAADGRCDDICKNVLDDMDSFNSGRQGAACGPVPSPGAPPSPVAMNDGTIKDDYHACVSDISDRYKTIGPHCKAWDALGKGKDWELASAILATTAAVSCGVACIWDKTPWGQGFRVACIVTGIASVITDIGVLAHIAGNVETDSTSLNAQAGVQLGVSAVASTLITISIITAGLTGSTTASRAESCVAFGLFTAMAAWKWYSFVNLGNHRDEECKTVAAYPDLQKITIAMGFLTRGKTGGGGGGGGDTATGGGSGGKGGTGGGGGGPGESAAGQVDNFLAGNSSAATDFGKVGEAVKRLIDKDKIKEALSNAALSTNKIGGALASGQSPATFMGGLEGFPAEAAASAANLEKQIKDGKITLEGMGGPASGGGGSASKGAAPAGGSLFGSKGAATGTDSVGFDKKKKEDLKDVETDDIFHEKWAGSIFTIITYRLGKTRDRIEPMEWQTPLNRALTGLSNKPGAAPAAAKPASATVSIPGGGAKK